MAKSKHGLIDKLTIEKIDEAAKIVDVVSDFITLKKSGKDYIGKCPFHNDRHAGSFVVSPNKNLCRCFVCQKTWFPIPFVQDYNKCSFPDALRYLADKYGIPIETEGKQYKKITPIKHQEMKLPTQYFPISYVTQKMANSTDNTLLNYIRRLPWDKESKEREYLEQLIQLYGIGTMTDAEHKGWTVFWQIDDQMRVRDGKVMQYHPNGKRVPREENPHSITWISSMLTRYKLYDPEKNDIKRCLFGLHLVDTFTEAMIYIVESEKTALIGTTYNDPDKVVFMATAGKSNLCRELLQPLIDRGRKIRLCPDKDSYDNWFDIGVKINYPNLSIITPEDQGWLPVDGPKADYADITIRELNEGVTREAKAKDLLRDHPIVKILTDKLNLKEITR